MVIEYHPSGELNYLLEATLTRGSVEAQAKLCHYLDTDLLPDT